MSKNLQKPEKTMIDDMCAAKLVNIAQSLGRSLTTVFRQSSATDPSW
jgi:hypothetical protein